MRARRLSCSARCEMGGSSKSAKHKRSRMKKKECKSETSSRKSDHVRTEQLSQTAAIRVGHIYLTRASSASSLADMPCRRLVSGRFGHNMRQQCVYHVKSGPDNHFSDLIFASFFVLSKSSIFYAISIHHGTDKCFEILTLNCSDTVLMLLYRMRFQLRSRASNG